MGTTNNKNSTILAVLDKLSTGSADIQFHKGRREVGVSTIYTGTHPCCQQKHYFS